MSQATITIVVDAENIDDLHNIVANLSGLPVGAMVMSFMVQQATDPVQTTISVNSNHGVIDEAGTLVQPDVPT